MGFMHYESIKVMHLWLPNSSSAVGRYRSLGASALDILRTSGLLCRYLRTNTLIFNDGLTI